MSELRVDTILSASGTDSDPVEFPHGLNVTTGYSMDAGTVNVTGVITATSYSGDGSGITNLSVVSPGSVIATAFFK